MFVLRPISMLKYDRGTNRKREENILSLKRLSFPSADEKVASKQHVLIFFYADFNFFLDFVLVLLY